MSKRFHGDSSMLESERRQKILPPRDILDKLDIKTGDTLIDFGAGIGYFSIPALDYVGESGKVIAIDISDEMIAELRNRTQGKNNIVIVKSDSLKGYKGNLILLVNVLHELDDKEEFIKECFDSLLPGGRLAIVDWQKKETLTGPPLSHRIAREDVIRMADKEYSEYQVNDESYMLIF